MTLHTVAGPTGPPVVVPTGVGVLGPFVEAGVFGTYEVQFAATVLRLQPGLGAEELVAVLAALERGAAVAKPQPEDGVTYAAATPVTSPVTISIEWTKTSTSSLRLHSGTSGRSRTKTTPVATGSTWPRSSCRGTSRDSGGASKQE